MYGRWLPYSKQTDTARLGPYPVRASMVMRRAKPTMAKRPFQFSAFVLQKALAKGSFLVYPLQDGLQDEHFPDINRVPTLTGRAHATAARNRTVQHQQEALCCWLAANTLHLTIGDIGGQRVHSQGLGHNKKRSRRDTKPGIAPCNKQCFRDINSGYTMIARSSKTLSHLTMGI